MGTAATTSQRPELSFRLFNAINENNFKEAIRVILKGANVNCINFIGGTPLIEMCRSKEHDEPQRILFVEFLLQNGADKQMSDIYGWTAELYAAEIGHVSIATMLETYRKQRKKQH
jgi:ankyrin repeat protein